MYSAGESVLAEEEVESPCWAWFEEEGGRAVPKVFAYDHLGPIHGHLARVRLDQNLFDVHALPCAQKCHDRVHRDSCQMTIIPTLPGLHP